MSANNNTAVAASLTQTKAVYDRLQGQIDTLAQTVHVSHNVITSSVTSWADVQAIVRAGLADKAFPIGTKMYCRKDNVTLEWDVIGIDHDTPADPQFTHSLTLQLHYCFPTAIQFDAPEALYYCETGLEAGTYRFTLSGTDYQFTASADIAAGSQLMLAFTSNVPSSITVASEKGGTVSEGSLDVTAGSGGNPLNKNYLNDINRVRHGFNNYNESALKQWLNNNAEAGHVWESKNNFDRPPEWHKGNNAIAGFMNGMDNDFLEVLGDVNKSSDTTTEKFFLLSESEVGGISGGTPYSYYAGINGAAANIKRIKTKNNPAQNNPAQNWWLRTPTSSSAISVRYIKDTGAVDSVYARAATVNAAPACCII